MGGKSLTTRQSNVLEFIARFLSEHGFPPTLREIGDAIGLPNVNAVRGHLAALEKKGYITKTPDKARSIRIVRTPSAFSRVKRRLHEVWGTDEGVLHRVVYGLAWCTSRRAPVLTGPCVEWVARAIENEAIEHGWTILDRRVEPDYIVIVVEVWPNHSAQQATRRFQAACSAVMGHASGGLAAEAPWGRGYVVTTDLDGLAPLVAKLLSQSEEEEAMEGESP